MSEFIITYKDKLSGEMATIKSSDITFDWLMKNYVKPISAQLCCVYKLRVVTADDTDETQYDEIINNVISCFYIKEMYVDQIDAFYVAETDEYIVSDKKTPIPFIYYHDDIESILKAASFKYELSVFVEKVKIPFVTDELKIKYLTKCFGTLKKNVLYNMLTKESTEMSKDEADYSEIWYNNKLLAYIDTYINKL